MFDKMIKQTYDLTNCFGLICFIFFVDEILETRFVTMSENEAQAIRTVCHKNTQIQFFVMTLNSILIIFLDR